MLKMQEKKGLEGGGCPLAVQNLENVSSDLVSKIYKLAIHCHD